MKRVYTREFSATQPEGSRYSAAEPSRPSAMILPSVRQPWPPDQTGPPGRATSNASYTTPRDTVFSTVTMASPPQQQLLRESYPMVSALAAIIETLWRLSGISWKLCPRMVPSPRGDDDPHSLPPRGSYLVGVPGDGRETQLRSGKSMLKSGLKLALCSAALAAPVMIGVSNARAEVIATATRINSTSARGTIPLNDSGGTALAFSTTKPKQKIVLTYNAECFIGGGFLAISILVDGKEANPQSGDDFAFCSSPGFWHGNVRQSIIIVPKAGAHAATVVATPVGSSSFSLDDSSFVIEK